VNRALAWFAGNPVAANLLMVLVVLGGLLAIPSVQQEIFPEASLGTIAISIVHEGAAPDDVESGICIPVEEAIQGIRGIRRITSTALEGLCTVAAEVERSADPREVRDQIETEVDALDHLPDDAETPIVTELESWSPVIDVVVFGDTDEATLDALGEGLRDELLDLPRIQKVELTGNRPDEISVEVPESELLRHGLRFDDVVEAIRRSSLDLPGGSLRTAAGEILLRANARAEWGPEFERIVLLSRPDGTQLRVGDIARVVDGYAETDQRARFDGAPAVMLHVLRPGDQRLTEAAATVRAWVSDVEGRLPDGIGIAIFVDHSEQLSSRRDLMLANGALGLLLVLGCLTLFLRARVALWVAAGIVLAFLGAVALMPLLATSLNMISSLGFLVALGLVTDDAIVVGERIVRLQDSGEGLRAAAVRGVQEMAVPVIGGALTTIVALLPCFLLPGIIGAQSRPLPIVVIACLGISLAEALLILPAHLAHPRWWKPAGRLPSAWERGQAAFSGRFDRFVNDVYRPWLGWALDHRALGLALGTAAFLVTLGCVIGGWVPFTFLPRTESDKVTAILTLPIGTSVEVTDAVTARIEKAGLDLDAELAHDGRADTLRGVYASIGHQPEKMSLHFFSPLAWSRFTGSHVSEVTLELAPAEERRLSAAEIARRWRELVGPVADAEELVFSSSYFSTGSPLHVQLEGHDSERLEGAADELARRLGRFIGVEDVASSHRGGKQEVRLHVLPEAEAHGLSLGEIARQVRQGFHGEEAQSFQRGRDEVAVMVRYPADERRSLGDLEEMRIRTPERDAVPLLTVARLEIGRGYASIDRGERRRAVSVTADVDPRQTNANQVLAELEARVLPEILAEHPGVSYSLEGQSRDQEEFMGVLWRGLIFVLIAIYAMLALPLRSYVEPLVILLAVPFGLVGAVAGHAILDIDLTSFSLIGMIGLTGVVVNDSLVLTHAYAGLRREGIPVRDAIERACVERFRPIVVTTLTTCLGVTPLLLETSTQALWIKPMAVSLAFGELFSMLLVLVLVPAAILATAGRDASSALLVAPLPLPGGAPRWHSPSGAGYRRP
jgi:multidrug efflux pump subunit AcrB